MPSYRDCSGIISEKVEAAVRFDTFTYRDSLAYGTVEKQGQGQSSAVTHIERACAFFAEKSSTGEADLIAIDFHESIGF